MSKLDQTIQDYRARAGAFWQARTEQERRLLAIAGVVVALGLLYGVLLSPALDGRDKLRQQLPVLRQQAAELQAMAQEAAALVGQNTIAPTPMTRETLTASLAARGLTAQSVSITGEYAKVQLNNVAFAGLVVWLDAVRGESRIAVQDANITAQDVAGMVNASVTLRQGTQ